MSDGSPHEGAHTCGRTAVEEEADGCKEACDDTPDKTYTKHIMCAKCMHCLEAIGGLHSNKVESMCIRPWRKR